MVRNYVNSFRPNRCRRPPGLLLLVMMALGLSLGWPIAGAAEEAEKPLDKSLQGLKFGVLAYIDYSEGVSPLPGDQEKNYNQFALTRGYITVQKKMNDWLGMRATLDVTQESKAPNTGLDGSYVVRLKYYYAELSLKDAGVFTDMKSELGMGHIPWLDFEEHVNPYRCQGTMAIERAGIFNSADLGVSLRGYFGGALEDAEAKTGSQAYAGRYGSWHLGVYNGSGYHAVENNQNKAVEGRVTVRPLPDSLPGLQFSYLGILGEGNQAIGGVVAGTTLDAVPAYQVNLGMVSFEHPDFILTGQYFTTRGNGGGTWIDPQGDALATTGWSGFANFKLPGTDGKASLFGRYDVFDIDPDDKWAKDTSYRMYALGLAFDVYKDNLLLIAYENTDYDDDADVKTKLPKASNNLGREQKIQVVWQTQF